MAPLPSDAVLVDRLHERVLGAISKDWLAPTSHRNAILLALWNRPDLVTERDVPGLARLAAAVTGALQRGKTLTLAEAAHGVETLRFSRHAMAEVAMVIEAIFHEALEAPQALRRVIECYAAEKSNRSSLRQGTLSLRKI